MVDLSSAPHDGRSHPTSNPQHFDRTALPVRYYFADLSKAERVKSSDVTSLRQDVRDCATMIDGLLVNVRFTISSFVWQRRLTFQHLQIPRVAPKLKALTKSMMSGTFGADHSRKLFEALCNSLDGTLFGTRVSGNGLGVGGKPNTRASTLALLPNASAEQISGPRRMTVSLPVSPEAKSESCSDYVTVDALDIQAMNYGDVDRQDMGINFVARTYSMR